MSLTFKPVAPVMKSTFAEYAHKSKISLQNTSLLNIYDTDEVCWQADYKVSAIPVPYFESQHSSQQEKKVFQCHIRIKVFSSSP